MNKGELRKIQLDSNILNLDLGKWNRIEIVEAPADVQFFISAERMDNLSRAEQLTDKIEVRKNGFFAESINLFLNTRGTSTDFLILRLTAISTSGNYFLNQKKEELKLRTDLENALLKSIFNPNDSFKIPITTADFYTLNTRYISCIEFNLSEEINIEFNDNQIMIPYKVGKHKIFTENLENIRFHNHSLNNIEIIGLSQGILPENTGYIQHNYFESGYIN